jgi:hypothetical protein
MAQGAAELAVVQSRLERDPVNTIIEIAKHYNVYDQFAAALGQPGQTGQLQGDTALLQKVAALEAQVKQNSFDPSKIDQHVSQAIQQREITDQVNAISKELPFFAEVENDMPFFIGKVMKANPSATPREAMEQAYDMATNADPTVRQKRAALEAQKATTVTADTKRVESAKKAASINVKPTSSGKGRVLTEDEALEAAFDRATAA